MFSPAFGGFEAGRSAYPGNRPVGGPVGGPVATTPTTFGSVALAPSLARQGMAARYGATGSLGPMHEPTTGGISGWMAPYGIPGRGAVQGKPKTGRPPVRIINPYKELVERLRPQYEARRGELVDQGDFGRVDELDRKWHTFSTRD